MIQLPKLIGRAYKPIDITGWVMSISGVILLAIIGQNDTIGWFEKITWLAVITFITLEYFWRVAYGRVYSHIYYDTIVHKTYIIQVNDDTYYISAENEDELDLYLEIHYPLVENNYKILDEVEVESYVKKEVFQ